ncbi:MAG: queuosine precursor transporter, partial [Bacteroidales bacterium]
MDKNKVSVPFMVLGIVFCVCLVVSNILETKLIQMGPITATAGLIV